MLAMNKIFFMPILNPDGAKYVEQKYIDTGKIVNKRKNMNPNYQAMCGDEDSGTDLNRNWGVDWQALDATKSTETCGEYWPGQSAFSEPETAAVRGFIKDNKDILKFIINMHTSGQEFIWPFNGRSPNDIDDRAPGYLAMFEDIRMRAQFPSRTLFGNAGAVIGEKMGGDADDYVLSKFGIPSVTAELGANDEYLDTWMCKDERSCFNILSENAPWIEYIILNIQKIA